MLDIVFVLDVVWIWEVRGSRGEGVPEVLEDWPGGPFRGPPRGFPRVGPLPGPSSPATQSCGGEGQQRFRYASQTCTGHGHVRSALVSAFAQLLVHRVARPDKADSNGHLVFWGVGWVGTGGQKGASSSGKWEAAGTAAVPRKVRALRTRAATQPKSSVGCRRG